MKKITFKVSSTNAECSSIIELIKAINDISCRISLDIKYGTIIVENIENEDTDLVIDIIDNHFAILSVDIETTANRINSIPFLNLAAENANVDILVSKVMFNSEYIEKILNSLKRSVAWALYKKGASEDEVAKHLYNVIDELSYKYNPPNVVDVQLGDIVDCSFGQGLQGEVIGKHVHALVCQKKDNLIYVMPIFKGISRFAEWTNIPVESDHDVFDFRRQ